MKLLNEIPLGSFLFCSSSYARWGQILRISWICYRECVFSNFYRSPGKSFEYFSNNSGTVSESTSSMPRIFPVVAILSVTLSTG